MAGDDDTKRLPHAGRSRNLFLPPGKEKEKDGAFPGIVSRPPEGAVVLPPGLAEEAFDIETGQGRTSLLTILYDVLVSVNQEGKPGTALVFVLSGPVTYLYGPGGGIPWSHIREVMVHPVNLQNISFRDGQGCIALNTPIRTTLVSHFNAHGLPAEGGPASSSIHLHLPGIPPGEIRIRAYTPVEVGYSATLWDILDPGTSIYIGSPEAICDIRNRVGELPDKRATLAGAFIRKADILAQSDRIVEAMCELAGAAQALGNARLRIGLYQAITGGRAGEEFPHFFTGAVNAKEQIDALWRFYEDGYLPARNTVLKRPVILAVPPADLPAFIDLARCIGIMCIVTRSAEGGEVLLDWNELSARVNEIGPEHIPAFYKFFVDVDAGSTCEQHPDLCIRVLNADGGIHSYCFLQATGNDTGKPGDEARSLPKRDTAYRISPDDHPHEDGDSER